MCQVGIREKSSILPTYGNRVMKQTNTDTIKMLYDGSDCVADYDNSGTPALLRYYITPNLDENLLMLDDACDDE